MSGDSGGAIYVSTHEDSKYIFVTIGDMGEGMDEAVVGRIFEPFYTTKFKGTGLGLAVTYKILELHEVKVKVESQKGKGTNFIMKFPVYSPMDTGGMKQYA